MTEDCSSEITWSAEDGTNISSRWWPAHDARGVVCLVHGLGEHSGSYHHVVKIMNRRGYSVLAPDLRGHGRSGGPRGYVSDFSLLFEEIQAAIHRAQELGSGPFFLCGQSMGANISARVAMLAPQPLAGVVLSSPMFELAFEPPRWKVLLGRAARWVWPRLTLRVGIRSAQLTRDPQTAARLAADTLRHNQISAGLYFGLVDSGRQLLRTADSLRLPTLVLHGENDSVTCMRAAEEFARRVGGNCTLKIWPQRLHELHTDQGWGEVVAYVCDWLDANLPY